MTQYAVIDADDKVLRIYLTPPDEAETLEAGESLVELADEITGWPEPPFPEAELTVDGVGGFVWLDNRTLPIAKASKWERVKAERSGIETGGFTWDGDDFDSDFQSQLRIQGAVQLALIAAAASETFSIAWTLADNTVRTLNGTEMVDVGIALATHVSGVFNESRSIRVAIEAATTNAAVEAISGPIGGPYPAP